MTLWRGQLDTPLGVMLALASERGLCALEFDAGKRHPRLEARLQRWFPPHDIADADAPVFARTRDWLAAYFGGGATDAPTLDLRGAPFELRVWAALQQIPFGETTSYGAIAANIGAPGAARAVGAANGANPVSLIVPCHRVIGSSGTLVGYGGGLDKKKWLLEHEFRFCATETRSRSPQRHGDTENTLFRLK
jgi:methylated-DNA-[protein]-cysteine S-methyltransferase